MAGELAQAILSSAQRLGVDPLDVATAVSYETAGTFDPWKRGPTTKWGQHRGLIQWGEPQRAKYGVFEGQPVGAQMQAAERYLKDAGVRPGMGLLDIYSAINAGRVGRYGASDAAAGGAPGTVADKVRNQMGGHRKNAEKLLGGLVAPATSTPAPSIEQLAPQAMAIMTGGQVPAVAGGPGMAPQADGLTGLASLFIQGQQNRQRQREEEQAAADARRTALLSGSLSGLFGA
jgi:hypothetical protein